MNCLLTQLKVQVKLLEINNSALENICTKKNIFKTQRENYVF